MCGIHQSFTQSSMEFWCMAEELRKSPWPAERRDAGGVAQLSTSFRSHLVGGWPTSLKNDGVNVSWDDDIPNWMEKSSGSSKPPTSQKNRIWNKRNQHITRVPRGMNRWITISLSYFAEQTTFSSSTAIHFSALTPFLNAKTTGAKWQVL